MSKRNLDRKSVQMPASVAQAAILAVLKNAEHPMTPPEIGAQLGGMSPVTIESLCRSMNELRREATESRRNPAKPDEGYWPGFRVMTREEAELEASIEKFHARGEELARHLAKQLHLDAESVRYEAGQIIISSAHFDAALHGEAAA